MIIIQNPSKDTYVTDIQTSSNNAINSNVGQSSTIDLFKIAAENDKTFARGTITFSANPGENSTIQLEDTDGVSKVFILLNDINGFAGNEIPVLINQIDTSETLLNLVNEINAVNDLKITASILYSDTILIKQNKPGESGETSILVEEDTTSNISKNDFVRFEHSAGLIKFDLTNIKNKYGSSIENLANSVYRDGAELKFSAFIKLIDVGRSSTKPKDFNLKLSVLKSDFKEGLGKDIVHFSDLDDANFVTINSKNNTTWTNSGIVSGEDLFEDSLFTFNEFEISTGKEDIEFDITDYFHNFIKETPNFDKESFVIHFPIEYLFDNNTYFVKRLGSRNLKNKQFIPQLVLKIEDAEFENVIIDKKRYFDLEENFYLLKVKGNTTKEFVSDNVFLKLNYVGDDDLNVFDGIEVNGENIYNFKGEKIPGIKKFTVLDTQISQITNDSVLQNDIENLGYAQIEIEYFYRDNGVESSIKKEKVKFYVTEMSQVSSNISSRNIRVSIDLLQKNLKANNTIAALKVSFIDINAQYKAVNTSTNLYSEDLGNITYEMYDIDTGKSLIENEEKYTQLFFDGKHYNLNIFASENFKNKRVNFIFKYTDPITGLDKKFSNDNINLRFV